MLLRGGCGVRSFVFLSSDFLCVSVSVRVYSLSPSPVITLISKTFHLCALCVAVTCIPARVPLLCTDSHTR